MGVQGTTQRFFVDSCGPGNVREGVESEPGGDLEDFIVRAAGGAAAVPVSLPQVHPDVRTAMDARAPGPRGRAEAASNVMRREVGRHAQHILKPRRWFLHCLISRFEISSRTAPQ